MTHSRRLAVMALVFAVLSFQSASGHPPTGKPAMKCYQSYADPSKEVCEASLYAVIANPDQYEGVSIRITGYLKRVYDVLVLYPGRDAYVYSAGRDGVELLVEHPDVIEVMRGKQEFEGAATVIGIFTAKIGRRVSGSVGMVTGDITVFGEEEPGVPPRLPPTKADGDSQPDK